jgi:hypothetical protein
MRCLTVLLAGNLLLLLRIGSVSLGETAEAPGKSPLQQLKDSPLRIVASLKNNNQQLPAILSGECNKYTAQHTLAYLDKDAKQLECNLVQNRFVPSEDGSYNLLVSVFRQTFKRSSEAGQWVSREGPTGMCGTVDVTTLEMNPNSPDFILTYSSLQIHTNRAGPLCKDLPNEEKETFLWKNPLTNAPLTLRNNKIDQMVVSFPPNF